MATEELLLAEEPVPKPANPEADDGNPAPKARKSKKAKEPKVKKSAASKKHINRPSHDQYAKMIKDAIVTLKEKSGSSRDDIIKFNEEKHKQLPPNFSKMLLFHLKKFVHSREITMVPGGLFKLPPGKSVARVAPKAAAVAKKPSKPKAAANKKKSEFLEVVALIIGK